MGQAAHLPHPPPNPPLKWEESCAIAGRVCRLLDPHKSRMHRNFQPVGQLRQGSLDESVGRRADRALTARAEVGARA